MTTLTPEQEAALDEARSKAAEETDHGPVTGEVVEAHGAVSVRQDQNWWTPRQIAALSAIGLDGVPEADLMAFLHLCQRSNLDPFAREIYLIGRWDKDSPNNTRYTAQTGIDGYRHLAERTGEYDGREGPWWCGPDGQWTEVWLSDEPPTAARVSVFRKGMSRPVTATALYREFVPMVKIRENGRVTGEQPTPMWRKMPSHMLAKCAEALAIRQAFPRQAAGIYVTEEMHHADQQAREQRDAEASAERAEQRRELVRTFGPGDPASPKDTAPGDVVSGEVVLDRDALWAELEVQAETLGKTVRQHATRWAKAHRKNIEDATAEELADLVESNRARVAEKRAQIVAEAVDEVAETTIIPDESDEPEGGGDAPIPAGGLLEAEQPHTYQDWGGVCIVCGEPVGDDRHTTP